MVFLEWRFLRMGSLPKGWRDGGIEIARSNRDVCVKVYLQGSGTRVPLLVWISGWSNSYWTSGKEKGLILLRERILNNWLYKNDLSQGSGPSQFEWIRGFLPSYWFMRSQSNSQSEGEEGKTALDRKPTTKLEGKKLLVLGLRSPRVTSLPWGIKKIGCF